MEYKLRPIQEEPVRKGIEFFSKKQAEPSIIVAPTAFGKSIVIAKIAESTNDHLLILQPSKELLEQNFKKYISLGKRASIYSASFGQKQISQVTFATIGSIKSIGKAFKSYGFTKMIIDEVHLFPRSADSMLGGFLKDSGITHVLGLTATPLKLQTNTDLDGNQYSKLQMLTSRSKKGNFFKEIIHVCQVSEMVENKYWSKLEYEKYDIDQSGLVYNSTKAEFTEKSLKEVYKTNDTYSKIIQKINDIPERKSIIVFVPSVEEAKALANVVPNSCYITGDLGRRERDFAVNGFKSGSIRVVFNVNVLSVGFDHPELDAIILARSTASFAWYYQALGRGTRISPNKKDCLIVDFSGNVSRFGMVEHIQIVKQGKIWKVFGEGGKLLTGIPMHEIGRHINKGGDNPDDSDHDIDTKSRPKYENKKPTNPDILTMPFGKHEGKKIADLPKDYRRWMLDKFEWKEHNKHLKLALIEMSTRDLVVQA